MGPLQPTSTPNIPITASHLSSHPDLLRVFHKEGTDESHVEVQRAFKKGETLAKLEGLTKGATKAYSSVQTGPLPSDHIELNSSFLFVNHSCSPNVAFHLSKLEGPEHTWRVEALEDLEKGTTLTFFYPSTEWEMDRGFDCRCGEKNCLGEIKGAKFIERNELEKQGWVAPHIWQLKEEQEKEEAATAK